MSLPSLPKPTSRGRVARLPPNLCNSVYFCVEYPAGVYINDKGLPDPTFDFSVLETMNDDKDSEDEKEGDVEECYYDATSSEEDENSYDTDSGFVEKDDEYELHCGSDGDYDPEVHGEDDDEDEEEEDIQCDDDDEDEIY